MAAVTDFLVTGTFTNCSDRRLKKKIKLSSLGIAEVMKMKPVAYNLKSDNSRHFGFIAQDMQEIIPKIVKETDSVTGNLGINYLELIPVLTNAIQNQKMELDEIKKDQAKSQKSIISASTSDFDVNEQIILIQNRLKDLKEKSQKYRLNVSKNSKKDISSLDK